MSIIERAAATSALPAFVLVYPHGLVLPDSVTSALDLAGIAHGPAGFPYEPEHDEGEHVVYLIDLERLRVLGNRQVIEQALLLIRLAHEAATVVIAPAGDPDAAFLAGNPHVGGWLNTPLDPSAVIAVVRNAAAVLSLHAITAGLRKDAETRRREAEHLLGIGVALSAERDIGRLQQTVVRSARELTRADSGSLFLLCDGAGSDERTLRFAVAQTGPGDSGNHLGATLPLSRASIAGYVALSGEVVRIEDAYRIEPTVEYRFNPSFDQSTNYRTKSVLCVPMRDHAGEIIGSIMLINRKPDFDLVLGSPALTERYVEPFDEHDEGVLLSLASQAGVALDNDALLESIQQLFEHFVTASVKAIEVRDTLTQGHSTRVAQLTVAQAESINGIGSGVFADLHFSADQLREMRYAALLHDFGKLAVPEYIFGKSKKLPDGKLDVIRLRFLLALEQIETRATRRLFALMKEGAPIDDPRVAEIHAKRIAAADELKSLLAAIESANEPRVLGGEATATLDALAGRTYLEMDTEKALLSKAEIEFLQIPMGSLSVDERKMMEQHVTQSYLFLREIPWTKTPWRHVPDLAHNHHEYLDGSGYPRGLKGHEIAPQVRMLTIADVFDALTSDRPYKAAVSVEAALDILRTEFAEAGKIDARLLDVFITKKVYELFPNDRGA